MSMYLKSGVVVDDDSQTKSVLDEFSGQAGIDLNYFDNPGDAMTFIDENNVDIVFVDFLLPMMKGVDMVRHLRQYHADIPIVVLLSVISDRNIEDEKCQSYFAEVLVKPLEVEKVLLSVRRVMER